MHRKQLAYWRAQLIDAPALLQLPTNRPRPSTQSYRGGRVRFVLSAVDGDSLRALAQRNGVTLFMTLLGGWSTLLARLSGQIELVVGTTAANRQRVESEALIGFFVNTLALRIDLSANPSVGEFRAASNASCLMRKQIRTRHSTKSSTRFIPSATLSPSSASSKPLLIAGELNPITAHLCLPGVEASLSGEWCHDFSLRFDISLLLADEGKGRRDRRATSNSATDLFDSDTIERLERGTTRQRYCHAMVADDRAAIRTLPLVEGSARASAPAGRLSMRIRRRCRKTP